MNEEILTGSDSLQPKSKASHEPKKRVSYVSKDLKSMIDFVAKVYNQLGHTNYQSNKAIATVHGLSPDSIKLHLSCAQQYMLFEIKYGVGYKVTEHFQKVFLPRTENEKRSAIIESLKHPETYQQLFKDYEYHVVPFDGVKNHFIRNFGLNKDVATKAAQIFIDNLKDYDLLDSRGVLTSAMAYRPSSPEVKVEEEVNEDNDNIETSTQQQDNLPATIKTNKFIFQSELDAAGKKTIPIHLLNNEQAMLVYPENITEDDIEIVKHQIDGILLKIRLETKQKAKEKGAATP